MDPTSGLLHLAPLQAFLWLTCAALLGVLLSVPMRHISSSTRSSRSRTASRRRRPVVLDARGSESRNAESRGAARSLALAASVGHRDGDREDARLIAAAWYRIPEVLPLGPRTHEGVGVSWSSSRSLGMIVGMRITTSMLLGMLVGWVIIPISCPIAASCEHGAAGDAARVMWPAVGMLARAVSPPRAPWRVLGNVPEHFQGEARQQDSRCRG